MSGAGRGETASSSTAPRITSATRAISCSPPRASSSNFLRFPLGDLAKEETRKLAREFGLVTAEKSDSQDICFVPTGRYTQVIERLAPGAAEAGDIVHIDGRVLGRHNGIINYTIGQRRGIGIAAPEPLYVLKLDAQRREVVVGPREGLRKRDFASRRQLARRREVGGWPEHGKDVLARIRSSGALQPARLKVEGAEVSVELAEGEDGVSPGQACVLYDADDGQRLAWRRLDQIGAGPSGLMTRVSVRGHRMWHESPWWWGRARPLGCPATGVEQANGGRVC